MVAHASVRCAYRAADGCPFCPVDIRGMPADVDRDPAPGTEAFDKLRREADERKRRADIARDERCAVRDADGVRR